MEYNSHTYSHHNKLLFIFIVIFFPASISAVQGGSITKGIPGTRMHSDSSVSHRGGSITQVKLIAVHNGIFHHVTLGFCSTVSGLILISVFWRETFPKCHVDMTKGKVIDEEPGMAISEPDTQKQYLFEVLPKDQ